MRAILKTISPWNTLQWALLLPFRGICEEQKEQGYMKTVSKKIKTLFLCHIIAPLPNKIITCQLFSAGNTSASLLSSCSEGVQVYLYVVNCSQIIPFVFLSLWPSGGNFWWLFVIEVVSGMLSGYNRLLLPVQEPSEWFTPCALPDAIRPTLMAVLRSEGKTHQTKCSYPVCHFQAILKSMNTLGAGRGRA